MRPWRHGAWLELNDLCPPERRVLLALGKGPKTIQEIERWGNFNGATARRRQQTVCRCLHRLIHKGLAEKTSRKRPEGTQGFMCRIYRLTWSGEMLWGSG